MTKAINIALVAGLLVAGSAQASGDYYVGLSKNRTGNLGTINTGSIDQSVHTRSATAPQNIESGDYYQGAVRTK
ncbi:MAG: hypothetical protein ACK4QP_19635 [Pseudorhizobium sp.]